MANGVEASKQTIIPSQKDKVKQVKKNWVSSFFIMKEFNSFYDYRSFCRLVFFPPI